MPQGDPTYTGYVAGTPDTYLTTRRSSRTGPASAALETQEVTHGLVGPISGRKVVAAAGTAVALAGAAKARRVIVQYGEGSGGVLVVGGSGVVAALATRTGFALYSPTDWIELNITDIADAYIDSTVSGDFVTFNYWTL